MEGPGRIYGLGNLTGFRVCGSVNSFIAGVDAEYDGDLHGFYKVL